MKLEKYVIIYTGKGPEKRKRCQHIKEPVSKKAEGEQCKLQIIIGDYCHRHYERKRK